MTAHSFRARARTVDHLGRGQIADGPTAVSELWKNAYDALALNVALHLFPGDPTTAAIFDDGVGMDADDIIERWLVIGTESKVESPPGLSHAPPGRPVRVRQGEKGIGRLSVAFLSPMTLLVSRKAGGRFVSVLVDWRLFENPFLDLSDVKVPVATADGPDGVIDGLPSMVVELLSNLGGIGTDRALRLSDAWRRYSTMERGRGTTPTADVVRLAWDSTTVTRRHLQEWPTFVGLGESGTALFMMGVNHELGVVAGQTPETDETEMVDERMRETLTAFTDPYAEERVPFDYEVLVQQDDTNKRVIAANDVFGLDEFRSLEHYVEGSFGVDGVFEGRIVAFGEDLGVQRIQPREAQGRSARDILGPFAFCIGTFEQDARRSTHDALRHKFLSEAADKFGGVMVYRDGLRVMPYGREDADFLGIEARRGKHAGRYFWAHRRSFGRIAFTRAQNPNLRDKAGREGLVDNRARRELRLLVENLLVLTAAKFFGTDSDVRKDVLPDLMARNAAAKAAADKARTSRRKGVRQFLNERGDALAETIRQLDTLKDLGEDALRRQDRVAATVMASRYREVLDARDGLRPPVVTAALGELEPRYREYRDGYGTMLSKVADVGQIVTRAEAEIGTATPSEAFAASFSREEALLARRLDRYASDLDSAIGRVRAFWGERLATDRSALVTRMGHFRDGVTAATLNSRLTALALGRADIEDEFAGRYPPVVRSLSQLAEGLDLEGAYGSTEDARADLEERVRNIHAVAQTGITVEIIGHELETLEAEVRRNFERLPADVRATDAYRAALRSHLALADRLRFLAPLKVAGYRPRETITGADIGEYLSAFFERAFAENGIRFEVTDAFRAMRFSDIPSRIFPVFINLVNNSAYWVSPRPEKVIRLDFVDGLAIVADTGPGVDVDDVPRLFELFHTRRRSGRGVGLYLSRVNLAVAGHRIRYAGPDDPKVLDGANFIIEFRGVTSGA